MLQVLACCIQGQNNLFEKIASRPVLTLIKLLSFIYLTKNFDS